MDLGAMVIKGCSAFPKAPVSLKHHHIWLLSVINRTLMRVGGLNLLQRFILQPQPTGQRLIRRNRSTPSQTHSVHSCKRKKNQHLLKWKSITELKRNSNPMKTITTPKTPWSECKAWNTCKSKMNNFKKFPCEPVH